MGLLSKFMNALGGEPSVSKPATQPVLRTAQQNVPKPTQQQTTQRKSTAQSRQAQQPTQPSQSSTIGAIVIPRANTNHSSQYFRHNESFASAISCQFTTGAEAYAATVASRRSD